MESSKSLQGGQLSRGSSALPVHRPLLIRGLGSSIPTTPLLSLYHTFQFSRVALQLLGGKKHQQWASDISWSFLFLFYFLITDLCSPFSFIAPLGKTYIVIQKHSKYAT